MTSGVELYKLINQSWLTMCTCSINNLLLAKYYESVLCGSVVCGNYPKLEDEIFLKNNMIYIDNTMTDEKIINNITHALKNKELLEKYAKNTYDYFSQKYMLPNGLNKFEKLINKL
jgi:chemotaxis methyl-accepting protein methylase